MNHSLTAATCAALLLCANGATATPNEYTPLMKARKYAEVERTAAARLSKEPNNPAALVARSSAIMAGGNQARLSEAIKYAEQCVASHPGNADCHLARGQVLGWKAMTGGMLAAMGSAGDIKDSFTKAVELDPRNLDARFSLLQFYMMAPSIAGGGAGKATDLVARTSPLSPEAAKVMQGMVEVNAGNLAKAESLAASVKPGTDDELLERHESLLVSIGGKYLADKKLADAERASLAALRHYPEGETATFLSARLRQEQGRHKEAIAIFEAMLAKNQRSYILYRMGQSHQALGDTAKAIASFEKSLSLSPTLNAKQKADAQSQLSTLKG